MLTAALTQENGEQVDSMPFEMTVGLLVADGEKYRSIVPRLRLF